MVTVTEIPPVPAIFTEDTPQTDVESMLIAPVSEAGSPQAVTTLPDHVRYVPDVDRQLNAVTDVHSVPSEPV